MPYGTRRSQLDYLDAEKAPVEIDFDSVWSGVVKPAIPKEFEMKRADEFHTPGLIDQRYIEWLYDSEIVIADLTFGNSNVYYELGIRQSLSKKGTILIACSGTRLPFDVRNQYVIHYDYFKAPSIASFQDELNQAIINASSEEQDSPVHVFLPGLVIDRFTEEEIEKEKTNELLNARISDLEKEISLLKERAAEKRLLRKIQEANSGTRLLSLCTSLNPTEYSIDLLEQLAVQLRKHGQFDKAIEILNSLNDKNPNDHEVLRELGFAYRKKGEDFYDLAEEYLQQALVLNDHDGELHGMLGGLLKRKENYLAALKHYQIANDLNPNDLYPLVNIGFIYAALDQKNEADVWYRKVKQDCTNLIDSNAYDYWTLLCHIEASVATNDRANAMNSLRILMGISVPIEDIASEVDQLKMFVKIQFSDVLASEIIATLAPNDARDIIE